MSTKLKPIIKALCLLSAAAVSSNLYAAASADNTAQMQKIAVQAQQLQQQMAQMQQEMAQLQQEEAALKQQQVATANGSAASTRPAPTNTMTNSVPTANSPSRKIIVPSQAVSSAVPHASKAHRTAYEEDVQPDTTEKIQNANGTETKVPYGQHALANLGGFAVITSPYLHPEVQYSGGDLIVNYSSINKDAYMLQQRQEFQEAMASQGFGMPTSGSLLELSGEVEGQALYQRNFDGSHNSDLYLSDAELDMQALINRWITAFMSFSYDDSPNDVGNRVNGDIDLDSGFFTIGNLAVTQWRLTMGQLYVPFGQFNSYLITDPINKVLFRTKGQPIIVGYGVPGNDGFSAAAYTFKGLSHNYGSTDVSNPYINQYGGDANYQFHLGKLQTTFGASFIANSADSFGMQSTDLPSGQFQGFGDDTATEKLKHQVPAVDARVAFNISNYTLLGEVDSVTRSFAQSDLSFNDEGAAPKAFHVEGVYSFNVFTKPSTFAVGYDHSYQALGLNVPEQRIAAAINVSPWRNTLASLEFRHDMNYGGSDAASGSGYTIITRPQGSCENAVTGEFQVFF
jgi:outer membrane murein-binding lipoprotein Lpp